MTVPLVIDEITATIEGWITSAVEFVPTLLLAIAVLVVGFVVGKMLGSATIRLAGRVSVGDRAVGSRIGSLFGGDPDAVEAAVGAVVKYYVLLFALFLAADIVGFAPLSEWLEAAVAYAPAFVAGLAIIVIGIPIAEYAGRIIRRSPTAEDTGFPRASAAIVQAVLYFVVVVIGLETMGIDVGILYVLVDSLGLAIALGIALAVGLAVGLGGKDYVAERIDEWDDRSTDDSGSGADVDSID